MRHIVERVLKYLRTATREELVDQLEEMWEISYPTCMGQDN